MNDIPPTASEATPLVSQNIVVPGNNGVTLGATLETQKTPEGPAPAVPAMLLVQGSGPVDRDGNVPGTMETDLQKQIAEALAEIGVVSLRYDKRGEYANKAELPEDKDKIAEFLAWDNLVGDAVAAWRFLCDQPGVDRDRVGFFGHSEGGIVALAAAQELADAGETPAALILAATPGRPMGDVIHEQIERAMERKGVKPQNAERLLDAVDNIQEEIAETGEVPDAVPQPLKPLYRPELAPYWHSLLNLDPADLAKLFPGPVLIIEGTADKQVSARDDALNLDAALSDRKEDDHDLLIVPRVTHELQQVNDPAHPSNDGPIKPSIIKDISSWVSEKLIAPH
ncbi:MAG TPA: alpha/beta hydrolase [Stellaceae bacterium]|jgi:hypothetical protein|nr:alpha/beta hydrolase [Stellaceae bacterium]